MSSDPHAAGHPANYSSPLALFSLVFALAAFVGLFAMHPLSARAAASPVITSGPTDGSTVATDTVTFTFTLDPSTTNTQCMFGATAFGCTSPQTYSALGDSAYVFEVAAEDGGGLWATTTIHFTVDTSTTTATTTETITASAGSGGTITPMGAVQVTSGNDQTFTIAPDASSTIADVLVDSVSVGATTTYTFTNVTTAHTIAASFASSTSPGSGVTAPVITSGPADGETTTTDTVTFTFDAPSASSTQCSFGGDPTVFVCFSPQVFSGLPNGTYPFSVAALTPAGAATTTRTFTVNAPPPAPPSAPAPTPAPVVSNGGGGGSPGLIGLVSNGYGGYISPTTGTQVVVTPGAPNAGVTGQVLGASTFRFTRGLAVGMRGDEVMELQRRLTAAGVYNFDITGYFGPITLKGVKAFQALNKLPQVGNVGPLTRNYLNGVEVAVIH